VADNGIPADRRRMIRRVMRPCHSERFSEGYRPVGGRVWLAPKTHGGWHLRGPERE